MNKYTYIQKLKIGFNYQFSLPVFKNRLKDIFDKLLEGLEHLVLSFIFLLDGLVLSPIQTLWQFSIGFLFICYKLTDTEADKIKEITPSK
jgi:hypothetical protein